MITKKLNYLIAAGLIFLCLIAFWNGLVYRLYALNNLGVILGLILAASSLVLIQYFYLISVKKTSRSLTDKNEKAPKISLIWRLLLAITYLILVFAALFILYKNQTSRAIISPWQVVPNYFYIIYSLASLLLLANIFFNQKFAVPLLSLHYFLSLAAALIVYRLGFGYDPFIHQATESLIAQSGLVTPKPFYYLGQYGLLVSLYKLTAIPLAWLDKLLVPVLAAISLPLVLCRSLDRWLGSSLINRLIILSLPALTFSFLIVTTPQNLAYLLLLLAIILGLSCQNLFDYLIILLLALTALITQPVAGVPALLFTGALAVYHSDSTKLKKYLYALLTLVTIFALPALFYFLNRRTAGPSVAGDSLNWFSFNAAGQSNLFLNFAYFYFYNYPVILLVLTLVGAGLAFKHRRELKQVIIYLIMALSLFASAFLTARLPFNFLINYERGDYAKRILLVAIFFLAPFFLIALYGLIEKVLNQPRPVKIGFTLFLAAALTASLYLSYPRYDDYYNSRGYSVSAADYLAVEWINKNAGADYIVLANQQVGAAALSRYGFKKYYSSPAGQLFYYPIPTSSPLYNYYLDMAYNKKPDLESMAAAMKLAGVKEAYFVLNKYWFDFNKTLAEAKLSAQSFESIADGQIYVFKYTAN